MLLGLALLFFSERSVTISVIVLLGAISAAVAHAATGTDASLVDAINATLASDELPMRATLGNTMFAVRTWVWKQVGGVW